MARRPWPRRPQLSEDTVERSAEIGGHLVHEADPERGLGVEPLARDVVAAGRALADLPQRERRDHRRDDPELDLGEGEQRTGLGDHDVAAGDEAGAASERMALHQADDRRRTRVDRVEHPAERSRIGDVRIEIEVDRRPHPLDVGARAEARAVAREDDRAGGTDVHERLGELGDQRCVEGVPRLRTGERHAQDVVVPFDAERAHEAQPMVSAMASSRLHGTIAAAATPLCDGGARLDDDAFGPYADYLVGAGLDGVLAFGTNGEAVLLSLDERRHGLELWLAAVGRRALVAAHCGAQTTADTVALAAHAAEAGADAVAAIGPPYFKLDPREQHAHLLAAARACAPLPFYVYEFAATVGYPFDPTMLTRLRDDADNFVGLKVSDTPWKAFEPYLLEGFDVFVGPESLIHLGREAGAVGAVSALAAAFPTEVATVVRHPTAEGAAGLAALRSRVESYPRHAALKRIVGRRGVPMRPDVRPPLRDLDGEEQASLEHWLASELGNGVA